MNKNKKPLDVAVAILIRLDGSFLMTSRPQGKSYAGYWEFPGGKIENNESPKDALRRECQEELGIQLIKAFPYKTTTYQYPELIVNLHFFLCTKWLGEPQPLENQKIAWLKEFSETPILPSVYSLKNLIADIDEISDNTNLFF